MKIWGEDTFRARHQRRCDQFGLCAETRIATTNGWTPLADVSPGMQVVTQSGDTQPIASVTSRPASEDPCLSDWPVLVPAGVVGNADGFIAGPAQSILFESRLAWRLFGAPLVRIRASDLDALPGVARVAMPNDGRMVHLRFATEQIILAAGGAPIVACGMADALRDAPKLRVYRSLNQTEAALILARDADVQMRAGSQASMHADA